ncbi:hypothetical protein ACFYE1_17070 [Kocuria sp. CPCC 205315]
MGAAVAFAMIWRKTLGQGPLERLMARAAKITRRLVLTTNR